MIEKYADRLERNTYNALLANLKFLTMQDMRSLYSSHHEAFVEAGSFFSVALWSFQVDLSISISRMFESNYNDYGTKKKNTVETTVSLLEEIDADSALPENKKQVFHLIERLSEQEYEAELTKCDILELLKQNIRAENDTLCKFRMLRNKIYAHSDKAVLGKIDQFLEENLPPSTDMERLLVLNMNICNCLQVIAGGSYTEPVVTQMSGSLAHLLELAEQGNAFDDYIIAHPEWAIRENLHIHGFS